MRQLALRISVSTLHGALIGAPRLAGVLKNHGCDGTFLWSFGPDASGADLLRALSPKNWADARRTHAFKHAPRAAWTYGTLRPAPEIGARAADAMRGVLQAGFEAGVHGWQTTDWMDALDHSNNERIDAHMQAAHAAFERVFGFAPKIHGAQHWQTNAHALRSAQQLGYTLASDTRGDAPFFSLCKGEPVRVMQLPTNLPTFGECIGRDGTTGTNIAAYMAAKIVNARFDHTPVLAVSAEREGGAWLAWFENLITYLKNSEIECISLSRAASAVDVRELPYCELVQAQMPGHAQPVMMQGIAINR